MSKKIARLFFLLFPVIMLSQEIQLFQQYNGRYDYVAFGNTLNPQENGGTSGCDIRTETSADFQLQPGQQVIAALLYWAGSGTGDFEVTLNDTTITSDREFAYSFIGNGGVLYEYFAAQANITDLVLATGNGGYTLTDLDLFDAIQPYCQINNGNSTNFGGWAVHVIYEDPSLPLNQVNVFDGLETVFNLNPLVTITLDNLNVLDNVGAKIGFLAWEGDVNLANNETLSINGNLLSNDPLNPVDNAFNGTNSFTNSNQFYNMDLDFYNIENNIQPGDTSAVIQLTSNQDLVMINNVITVLNTELPDATITIDNTIGGTECGNLDIVVDYTVYNVNSTKPLPPAIPIAFYANTTLVGQTLTVNEIPIGGSESGSINLTIPDTIPADFELTAVVDDNGSGIGIVNEHNEDNNSFTIPYHLLLIPDLTNLRDLELCDVLGLELFDLHEARASIPLSEGVATFFNSESDAQNNINPIANPEAYENITNPEIIWIRLDNGDCFSVGSFEIEVIVCPLPDATIQIVNNLNACRQRNLLIDYVVHNTLGTAPLPRRTPIAFYIDGNFVFGHETIMEIPIGGSEPNTTSFPISENVPDTFTLLVVVDDGGNGVGSVQELNEFNNEFEILVEFGSIPPISMLPDLLACDEGFNTATFDLTVQNELISTVPTDFISYHTNIDDAIANLNPILDPEQYENTSDPQTIYVRLENEICFTNASFLLTTENCPPLIPQGMSPNGDGLNDLFQINGLLNIYENFNLKIYTRLGNLIYEGGNEEGLWNGIPNTGLLYKETLVPVGVYYYVLQLNDSEFPDPFLGFLYVNY